MSSVRILFQDNRNYLESKANILAQIAKCKLGWQVSVWESTIENIFFKKVWNETKDHFITSSHCNDLQKACLIQRWEIIAQS